MTEERRVVERVDRVDDAEMDPVVDRRTTTTSVASGPSGTTMARRLVTLLFGILQVLIVLRIVLLLLAANQDNGIVSLVLGATDPFIEPFRGIFRLDEVSGRSGSILDVGAIVALLAWTLIEALVLAIVGIGARRSDTVA
jgi:uncharacterized protein YggT (Ycf19 family)